MAVGYCHSSTVDFKKSAFSTWVAKCLMVSQIQTLKLKLSIIANSSDKAGPFMGHGYSVRPPNSVDPVL